MEPVLKGLRFARHKELDRECWSQPLKARTEQHDAEASGPSARLNFLGGFWEIHAMKGFKLELVG